MTPNLLKYLPKDNSSLYEGANSLMVMSDEEYIMLAYLLRKIIRECDFDPITGDISLRGFYLMDWCDGDMFVVFSKLISHTPYMNQYEAKTKVEEVTK